MLNEELIREAEALMRARATYFKNVGLPRKFETAYHSVATGYEFAADILRDAINGDADILRMKWDGYERYDPRLKPFEVWDIEDWPEEGDYFSVGRYAGKCVRFEVDYKNTSATAWMLVED